MTESPAGPKWGGRGPSLHLHPEHAALPAIRLRYGRLQIPQTSKYLIHLTMAALKDNGLPPVSRVITDHDSSGKAVFSTAIPEPVVWQELADGARFSLGYATNQFPAELSNETDVKTYSHYLEKLPGIAIPGGTVLRYVDMMPGATSPMHRTVSLDYGVVLEGEVELVLDSGEVRLLKRGHVAVQRGTNHAWRNASKTEWARMLYVLQDAKPLEIGGKKLEEDVGTIPGYGDK